MAESEEEIATIKERFSCYITKFNEKYFENDLKKIQEMFKIVDNKQKYG